MSKLLVLSKLASQNRRFLIYKIEIIPLPLLVLLRIKWDYVQKEPRSQLASSKDLVHISHQYYYQSFCLYCSLWQMTSLPRIPFLYFFNQDSILSSFETQVGYCLLQELFLTPPTPSLMVQVAFFFTFLKAPYIIFLIVYIIQSKCLFACPTPALNHEFDKNKSYAFYPQNLAICIQVFCT